ncbi:peptidylprolyl isomerase [Bacillus niameyensis]|uniref:peptidylprolyl isomerase n=1 Tax=Bacillus niameyensis TaxID=1522308 RepID=UPI000780B785|nr:peptidylprolyl isomerase [Bacillus niameyensis]
MKKWILSLTLAAGVVGLAACSGNGGEDVAKTKAGNVTKDELYQAMKERIGEPMLQQLVLEKVLEKEYKVSEDEINERLEKIKGETGEQFESQILQYGYKDEDDFRTALKFSLLQEKAAIKDVKVTEDEVKEYYDNLELPIEVRHIIVDPEDEELAKEIKAKLDKGEDFAKLAEEYSIDGTKETGGDLGKIEKDNEGWDADFREAAFKLKKDEISEPVKTQFGWHIIQVTDKPEKEPFDKAKDEYEYELKLSKLDNEAVNDAVKKEVQNAKVDIKDKELKSALDSYLKEPEAADQSDDDSADK